MEDRKDGDDLERRAHTVHDQDQRPHERILLQKKKKKNSLTILKPSSYCLEYHLSSRGGGGYL